MEHAKYSILWMLILVSSICHATRDLKINTLKLDMGNAAAQHISKPSISNVSQDSELTADNALNMTSRVQAKESGDGKLKQDTEPMDNNMARKIQSHELGDGELKQDSEPMAHSALNMARNIQNHELGDGSLKQDGMPENNNEPNDDKVKQDSQPIHENSEPAPKGQE